jgi:hypothetical protein
METKTCQNCKNDFIIEPDDFSFYEKIKVPPPTFCPECRMQRRLAWRNEKNLHKRKCDLCEKTILAIYPENTIFPVYCNSCWFSDEWDPLVYGQQYDFYKTFFEQFQELKNKVPRLALQMANCVDMEYANAITHSKNCYLCFSTANSEDSMYSVRLIKSKNISNSYLMAEDENCNYCVNCSKSSYLDFCQNSTGCFDCTFCYDMRGSSNCFLCNSGRQIKYSIKNQQLTKEEYQQKINEIDTGSYKVIEEFKNIYQTLVEGSIHKYAQLQNTVNTTGDMISNAKDCKNCFFGTDIENCTNCLFIENSKDCMDVCYGCCTEELMYEVSSCGVNCSRVFFSKDAWPEVKNSEYIDSCRNSISDCFGCVSLRKKSFCILNKQYSKEEYESLRLKIIQQMSDVPYIDTEGIRYTYGEFFPIAFSPHPYMETTAMDYFPLTKEQILAKGYNWVEPEQREYQISMKIEAIPDNIKDISLKIVDEIIECMHKGECKENCTEAFRVTNDEFTLYQSKNLPLPRLCPNCRLYEAFSSLPKPKLYKRTCMNGCGRSFDTSYSPERPEKVYCERCYQQEVL